MVVFWCWGSNRSIGFSIPKAIGAFYQVQIFPIQCVFSKLGKSGGSYKFVPTLEGNKTLFRVQLFIITNHSAFFLPFLPLHCFFYGIHSYGFESVEHGKMRQSGTQNWALMWRTTWEYEKKTKFLTILCESWGH